MRFFALCVYIACQFAIINSAQAAQPIGRLFSTPAERNSLNYLRQTKKVLVVNPAQEPTLKTEPVPLVLPDAINMQGYVKRSDGKQGTVWINNQALQENSGNKEVQVGSLPENGNRVPLKLPANGRRLTLKAGQVYEPENNRVTESRSYSINKDAGRISDEEAL